MGLCRGKPSPLHGQPGGSGQSHAKASACVPRANAGALGENKAPGWPSGSNSLGGNSRHTGHQMQAGRTPFSVNLLGGSACFHGDLTSEIFHLGCQMPVDEAKPPRVTKYRHSPAGSGARASSGFRVGAWTPGPGAATGPTSSSHGQTGAE